MKWTSVKDDLPPIGKRVMVCGVRGGINIGRRYDDDATVKIEASGTYRGITHWADMPKGPNDAQRKPKRTLDRGYQ